MILSWILIGLFAAFAIYSLYHLQNSEKGNWEGFYLASCWTLLILFFSMNQSTTDKLISIGIAFAAVFVYVRVFYAIINGIWEMISQASTLASGINKKK